MSVLSAVRSSFARWGGAAALFAAGAGIGVGHARLGHAARTAPERQAEQVALCAADAVSRDELSKVWDMLDPGTRDGFAAVHARLVEFVKTCRDDPKSETARLQLGATQSEYAMSVDELLATTPESLWVRRTARAVNEVPQGRAAFASVDVTEVRCEGDRARVRSDLASGLKQGFHLVRRGDAWTLLDFQPYWDVDRWPPVRQTDPARQPRGK